MLTDKEIYKQAYEFYNSLYTKDLTCAELGIKCFVQGAKFIKEYYEKELAELQKMYSESCSFHTKAVESLGENYKKKLAEKDKQIKKMKCCDNCTWQSALEKAKYNACELPHACSICAWFSSWELKE